MPSLSAQSGLSEQAKAMPRWVTAPTPMEQAAVGSSIVVAWLLSEGLSANLMAGPNISGWYPTAGIGLAALWGLGLRYVWAIGIAALIGILAVWGRDPLTAVVGTSVKLCTYGGTAWVLRQVLPPPVSLHKPMQAVVLLLMLLLFAFATATFAALGYSATGGWDGPLGPGILSWAVGDAIGVLVLTPFLMLVVAPWACDRFCPTDAHDRDMATSFRAWREPVFVILGSTLAIILLYLGLSSPPDFRVFYLGFVVLPSLAIAYGLAGGLIGLFILNALGMIIVSLPSTHPSQLQDVQIVMIALAICTLLVGAFSTMRATAAAAAETGEKWLDLAFRGSGMGRWYWRVGTDINACDYVLTDLLGYDRSQVQPTTLWWNERIHPDDLPGLHVTMQRHLEGKTDYFDAEVRIRNSEGQWRWMYTQGTVTERDEQGRPLKVAGTHSEITERKKLKQLQEESEARHRSEMRFRTLADAAPVGIFQTDDRGVFLYMNPAWAQITGFDINESLYRHAAAFVYADDREDVSDAWATAVASRTPMTCEHRVLTPSGELRWIAIHVRPSPEDRDSVGGFVGTVVDVTPYREQVQLIRDSETRYRTLAEHSHDMLWRVTLDAHFTYVSPSCELLMGFKPWEMVGTDAYDYFHPDDVAQVRDKHEALTLEAPQFKDLHRYRRKDGSYIWFEAVGQLVVPEDDPKGMYIVGISRDVTARIQAEEHRRELETRLRQSQKLDAIGTFATGIAHDFRNTLLAIAASVQSAQKKLDHEHPAARPLDLIEDACRQSMEITQSLLTFTRGSGRRKEDADLAKLVSDTTRMISPLMPLGVQVCLELPDEPVRVHGNPSELQQVIMNLTTNARDALGKAGGDIRISVHLSPEHHAVLRVVDRGQGMSAETMSRVFEPFFTTKSRLKGTGLGLALVHGIVTQHHGQIEINSSPESGTAVTVTFPAVPTRPPAPPPAASIVDNDLVSNLQEPSG